MTAGVAYTGTEEGPAPVVGRANVNLRRDQKNARTKARTLASRSRPGQRLPESFKLLAATQLQPTITIGHIHASRIRSRQRRCAGVLTASAPTIGGQFALKHLDIATGVNVRASRYNFVRHFASRTTQLTVNIVNSGAAIEWTLKLRYHVVAVETAAFGRPHSIPVNDQVCALLNVASGRYSLCCRVADGRQLQSRCARCSTVGPDPNVIPTGPCPIQVYTWIAPRRCHHRNRIARLHREQEAPCRSLQ